MAPPTPEEKGEFGCVTDPVAAYERYLRLEAAVDRKPAWSRMARLKRRHEAFVAAKELRQNVRVDGPLKTKARADTYFAEAECEGAERRVSSALERTDSRGIPDDDDDALIVDADGACARAERRVRHVLQRRRSQGDEPFAARHRLARRQSSSGSSDVGGVGGHEGEDSYYRRRKSCGNDGRDKEYRRHKSFGAEEDDDDAMAQLRQWYLAFQEKKRLSDEYEFDDDEYGDSPALLTKKPLAFISEEDYDDDEVADSVLALTFARLAAQPRHSLKLHDHTRHDDDDAASDDDTVATMSTVTTDASS